MDTKATFNGVSKNVLELTCSALSNVIVIFIGATFVSPGDVADVEVPVVVSTLGLGITGDVIGVGCDVIACVESNDVVDCPSAVFTTTVFAVVLVIILEDVSTIKGVVVLIWVFLFLLKLLAWVRLLSLLLLLMVAIWLLMFAQIWLSYIPLFPVSAEMSELMMMILVCYYRQDIGYLWSLCSLLWLIW